MPDDSNYMSVVQPDAFVYIGVRVDGDSLKVVALNWQKVIEAILAERNQTVVAVNPDIKKEIIGVLKQAIEMLEK